VEETDLTAEELGRVRAALERVPFAHLLGIELEAARRGAVVMRLKARAELKQSEGIIHGGATASLIDTAAAFAVLTVVEPGERTTTTDLTIHYLRPIISGRIRAQARVLRAGRRLVTVSIEVTDDAGALAATGITTYLRVASDK
jgi:uncharacterized protein (TIGR00369 family)